MTSRGKRACPGPNKDPLSYTPEHLAGRIKEALETVIALAGPLPNWLIEALQASRSNHGQVKILFDSFNSGSYLAMLHRCNFMLYEAVLPGPGLLFIDRELGVRLPSLQPIKEAFPLACQLLWRRLGVVVSFQGVLTQSHPDLIRIELGPGFGLWLSKEGLAGNDAVKAGNRVKILGISSFLASRTNPMVKPLEITPLGE